MDGKILFGKIVSLQALGHGEKSSYGSPSRQSPSARQVPVLFGSLGLYPRTKQTNAPAPAGLTSEREDTGSSRQEPGVSRMRPGKEELAWAADLEGTVCGWAGTLGAGKPWGSRGSAGADTHGTFTLPWLTRVTHSNGPCHWTFHWWPH